MFPNVGPARLAGRVWPSLHALLAPEQMFALLIAHSAHILCLFEHLLENISQ